MAKQPEQTSPAQIAQTASAEPNQPVQTGKTAQPEKTVQPVNWVSILKWAGRALLFLIVLMGSVLFFTWGFGKIRQTAKEQPAVVQQNLQSQGQQPQQPQDVQTAVHSTWSLYGDPSFIVNDGKVTGTGSDLFTDPTKGSLTLEVKPTESICLLQYGVTQVFTSSFSATFAGGDTGAGFRVIAKSYWEQLPQSDGAYQLCWNR